MQSSTQKIKVSAITSCFNGAKYLPIFLENYAEQTIKEQIEIILVHNQPAESETKIVKDFQSAHPGLVKHIVVPREPLPVSTNRALSVAAGEYVCVWNVDDLRTKNSLELMKNTLDEYPQVDFTYGDYIRVNQWLSQEGELFTWPEFDRYTFVRHMMLGPFYMWRRSACERLGYWDEQFKSAADFDYAIRLAIECEGRKTCGLLGYYLNEGVGLSTNKSQLPQVEGTFIQLRYAKYKELHLAYWRRACKMDRHHALQMGKWVTMKTLCPHYRKGADHIPQILYALARNAYWMINGSYWAR